MAARDVLAAAWRRRLPVVLVVVVAAVAALIGAQLAPQRWTATALVQVVVAEPDGSSEVRVRPDDLAASLAAASPADVRPGAPAAELSSEGAFVRVEVEAGEARTAAARADAVAAALTRARIGEELGPGGPAQVVLVAPAGAPSATSSPWLGLLTALAALVAAGLTAVAAGAPDRRVLRLDDVAEVEAAVAAPLLARFDAPRDLTELPALTPGTAAAEAFRHLAWTVRGRGADAAPPTTRTVAADVVDGDDHVWVGANLAISLAQAGRRVLLADGRMGERFGVPGRRAPDTPGLYDVLGGADLGAAVTPGPVSGLQVLPSGTWGDEPVGTLLARRFAAFLDSATSSYDDVVVLGPPLEDSDDSRVMAEAADLVLTVAGGAVTFPTLRGHAERLRAAGARVLGTVVISRP
nr:Wzz/FepE/Etk N-terminal domain-containing protein [Nocardioides flavescens]